MFVYLLFIIIFICILIILLEYLWLYLLAKRRAKQKSFLDTSTKKITEMFEAAMHSSTQSSLIDEVASIKKYVGNNAVRMDIASDYIYNFLIAESENNEKTREKQICVQIFNEINPNKFYSKILEHGDNFDKAFACRKLSEFDAVEMQKSIRGLVKSGNLDLKYHAVMALSALGDHDGLITAFTGDLAKNYYFSHRIMIEVLDVYSGNRITLVKELLEKCNDYIKGIVIKAVGKYRYEELADTFILNLTNKDIGIKIACIRAIGFLADPKYEHELIIMTNDKEWSVRAAAVKSLEKYDSKISLDALSKATNDPNWWVRNNAAKSLVKADESLTYAKGIINGYDRFAADAVKCAIYKKYKI